ncbi:hypothetical protein KKI24_12880 [bacterium]|nr:hypothetical protein [bacterium]
MKHPITLLLITGLVLTSACGYRTAPEPYDRPDETIPTVSEARLNAQGDDWVFRWQIPEDGVTIRSSQQAEEAVTDPTADGPRVKKPVIQFFRINIFRAAAGCSLCKSENLGHFLIDPAGGEIRGQFPDEMVPPVHHRFYVDGPQTFRVDLPLAFFRVNQIIDRSFYTIDYLLDNEVLSLPSRRIYPLDLKTVPVPVVRVRKLTIHMDPTQQGRIDHYFVRDLNRWLLIPEADDSGGSGRRETFPVFPYLPLMPTSETDDHQPLMSELSLETDPYLEQCERPRFEYFLVLEWDLKQETLRHTMQKDGKIHEQVIHYGVNFYEDLPAEPLPGNPHRLINPDPLRYGRFSLLNFQGRLLARHVDRFGNESRSVPVFNGRY